MRHASPHDIARARERAEAARNEIDTAKRALDAANARVAAAKEERDRALEALAKHRREHGTSKLPMSLQGTLLFLVLVSWPVALVLSIADFGWLSVITTAFNSLLVLVLTLARTKPAPPEPH